MSRSKKYKFLRAPSIVSDHLDHLGTNIYLKVKRVVTSLQIEFGAKIFVEYFLVWKGPKVMP